MQFTKEVWKCELLKATTDGATDLAETSFVVSLLPGRQLWLCRDTVTSRHCGIFTRHYDE